MYSNTSKDEVIVRLVGRLSLEFPELDLKAQLKVRNIVEEVLYKYDVLTQETSLVASDIEEKMHIYIATKRLEGLSGKTLKNYIYEITRLGSCLKKPLAGITSMDIKMYLSARCKELLPSSSNSIMSYLRTFFAWLANEEYIPKNPMTKIKPIKEPKRCRQPLTEEEIETLRQVCIKPRDKAMIEFLISTGCRLSEVVGVDKEDINWYEMSLFVIGKGNKERKVYFSTKAKILLKKYIASRLDANPALFVSEKRPYTRLGGRAIQVCINKIKVSAGFDKAIYPHLFRHSYATHKLNSGMSLPVLQQLMGHADPATTQIYAKLDQENVKHEYRRTS